MAFKDLFAQFLFFVDAFIKCAFQSVDFVNDAFQNLFLFVQHCCLFGDQLLNFGLFFSQRLRVEENFVETVHGHFPQVKCFDGSSDCFGFFICEIRIFHNFLVEFSNKGLVDVFFIVAFELFQEGFGIVEEFQSRGVEPIFLFFDGAFDFFHNNLMTFGENHVLEEDDTTTKDNNSDFRRVLV